jgi:diaminopropionate ammonia-lyase
MRYRTNRFLGTAELPVLSDSARAFHASLDCYAPTPLRVCPALAAELSVRAIYVKDESFRFGTGAFKVLGASWAMHQAIKQTSGSSRSVFACATDGNHGRAVAWMARRLGAAAKVFVPANTVSERIEAIRREGADVTVVSGTYDEAVRRCARESAANGWQVISDTGYGDYRQIPVWVTEGYQTLFSEFEEQREAMGLTPPDLVLIQAGVGGLLAAAVSHFRRFGDRSKIVSVEPEDAACLLESIATEDGRPTTAGGGQNSIMAGLNCGEPSLTAWPLIRSGVDAFLAIEDSFAVAAMRRFYYPAKEDPRIVSGESGAAGLGGLIAMREEMACPGSILLINTEGATDPESFRQLVDPDFRGGG